MFKLNKHIDHSNWKKIESELVLYTKSNHVLSIMLIGSYSRGDYWRDGIHESDVEFYIIIDDNSPTNKKTNFKFCDVSIIIKKEIKHLQKNLINYEAKKMGITIFGEDLRYLIPDIRTDNIEQDIVDEIILFRFLEIADFIVKGKDIGYAFAKNLNYLIAWSLIKDGILLPGFVKRNNSFNDNKNVLEITNDLFSDIEDIFSKLIGARFGKNPMPDAGPKIYEAYDKLMYNYSNGLFKKRNIRSIFTQIFYIITSSNLLFFKKIKYIILSIFGQDYRIYLLAGLYKGIKNRDSIVIIKYQNKCYNYYPFLREKQG